MLVKQGISRKASGSDTTRGCKHSPALAYFAAFFLERQCSIVNH